MKKLSIGVCFTLAFAFLSAQNSQLQTNPDKKEPSSQTPKDSAPKEDSSNDTKKEALANPFKEPIKEDISLPINEAPTQNTEEPTKAPKQDTTPKSISKTPKPSPKKPIPKLSENSSSQQEFLNEKAKEKKVTFIQEEFYEPKKNEVSLERKNKILLLNIHSKELQKFMEGAVYSTKKQVQTFALADSFTQITNIDGKIYEYKYAQKSIDRYSTIAPYKNYPLKKISSLSYEILIKKIPQIFDIKDCKIAIKKELSGTLNQRQEVIINLDTKRELRNNSHFDLFLECPR